MSKLQELGDLGDRMMQGLPFAQGGAVSGASDVSTFTSPDVSQDPSNFDTLTDKSKITVSSKDSMSKVTPFGPYTGQNPRDYVGDVEKIKYWEVTDSYDKIWDLKPHNIKFGHGTIFKNLIYF